MTGNTVFQYSLDLYRWMRDTNHPLFRHLNSIVYDFTAAVPQIREFEQFSPGDEKATTGNNSQRVQVTTNCETC
jgi:hypothetical protein